MGDATTCSAGYYGNGHYFLYTYTGATIEGSTTFDANSFAGWKTWSAIGTETYQVRLLLDDGYRSAAVSLPFKIVHERSERRHSQPRPKRALDLSASS